MHHVLRCILAFLMAVSGQAEASARTNSDVAPPLHDLEVLQGGPSVLAGDRLRGKVIVLHFWSTSSHICARQLPHANELARQFADAGVVTVFILSESAEHRRPFIRGGTFSGLVGIDHSAETTGAYGISDLDLPRTVLVGRDGRVLAITHPAYLRERHLEAALHDEPLNPPLDRAANLNSPLVRPIPRRRRRPCSRLGFGPQAS